MNAYPQWFLLLLAQSLLLLLLWIWMKGRHFGPLEIPREWSVRFSDERIKAIAAWYERNHFYHEALSRQLSLVRQVMQERWGVPEIMETKTMLSMVKHRLSSDQVLVWKETFGELEQVEETGRLSPKQFLRLSQHLDRIRKEIINL